MFFAEGRFYVSEKYPWPGRCFICDIAEMTAQRIVDLPKRRTYVRLSCPCGFETEFNREFDRDHDFYQLPPAHQTNGHQLTNDQAKRLADLLRFIDQEENQ